MSSELLTLFREFICEEGERNKQRSKLVCVSGFPFLFGSRDDIALTEGECSLHLMHSPSVALSLIRHV